MVLAQRTQELGLLHLPLLKVLDVHFNCLDAIVLLDKHVFIHQVIKVLRVVFGRLNHHFEHLIVPQFLAAVDHVEDLVKDEQLASSPVGHNPQVLSQEVHQTNDSHVDQLIVVVLTAEHNAKQQNEEVISCQQVHEARFVLLEETECVFAFPQCLRKEGIVLLLNHLAYRHVLLFGLNMQLKVQKEVSVVKLEEESHKEGQDHYLALRLVVNHDVTQLTHVVTSYLDLLGVVEDIGHEHVESLAGENKHGGGMQVHVDAMDRL